LVVLVAHIGKYLWVGCKFPLGCGEVLGLSAAFFVTWLDMPRIQKSFPGIPIGTAFFGQRKQTNIARGDPETRGLAQGLGRLAHQLSTGALFSRKSNHLATSTV
jgi:hypothetical protein